MAAQVGSIWLLCARTAVRFGLVRALAVGLGAAVVGAGVLRYLGGRTLWCALRVRAGFETESEAASPLVALRTSVIATASNPLTIASWAAVLAAASTARFTSGTPDTLALLIGIGVGILAWHVVLSIGMRLARRRIGERGLRTAEGLASLGMIGYGGLLGLRTLEP